MRSSLAEAERTRIVTYIREQAALVLMGGVSGKLDIERSEFAASVMEEVSASVEKKQHWNGYQ
jgi:sRNA-binding protein